ncbi:MAG: cell envelope biogenesis protein OmpA [Candidatus Binatia bacterium]|nr:cell envelope biogenesis protein OmpA [Candidatus Binatia bacterium]MDG2009559.1 cell envelope biogenesis protein OmpA [Candidatus Binatia bacterium]
MKKTGMTVSVLGLVTMLVLPSGCSARDPQPELYPNAHLRKVGDAQAKQDIAYCQALSQQYLQKNNAAADAAGNTVGGAAGGAALGAIGGAIGGNAGKGAAIGAGVGAGLGLLRGLSKGAQPPQNYEAFVRKCMTDKGYDVIGFGR